MKTPGKERRVTCQVSGTEYRVVHHGWDRHPGDALWGEFGIYTGDGREDVATFSVPSGDPDRHSDDELIAMAMSVVAEVEDGTW
jgi:hypothetical protein